MQRELGVGVILSVLDEVTNTTEDAILLLGNLIIFFNLLLVLFFIIIGVFLNIDRLFLIHVAVIDDLVDLFSIVDDLKLNVLIVTIVRLFIFRLLDFFLIILFLKVFFIIIKRLVVIFILYYFLNRLRFFDLFINCLGFFVIIIRFLFGKNIIVVVLLFIQFRNFLNFIINDSLGLFFFRLNLLLRDLDNNGNFGHSGIRLDGDFSFLCLVVIERKSKFGFARLNQQQYR